MTVTES